MKIERATMDDVDDLADCWVDLARDQRRHRSRLRAEANRLTIRESLARHVVTDGLLVARESGIVGFVMYHVEDDAYVRDVSRGVVSNIFVRRKYRRRGIGSALLAATEADLSARGVDEISLEVMAQNADARRFYERHGYREHRIEMTKSVESDTLSNENA